MSETNIVTFRRHILESENPLNRPFQQPSLNRYYASFFDSWEPRFSQPQFSQPQFSQPQFYNSSFTKKTQTNIPWILLILLLSSIFLLK